MMSCREVCEKAQDHVDGELSALSRLRIRLHVMMCRNCAGFLDQTRQTRRLIGESGRQETETRVPSELMAALRDKTKER